MQTSCPKGHGWHRSAPVPGKSVGSCRAAVPSVQCMLEVLDDEALRRLTHAERLGYLVEQDRIIAAAPAEQLRVLVFDGRRSAGLGVARVSGQGLAARGGRVRAASSAEHGRATVGRGSGVSAVAGRAGRIEHRLPQRVSRPGVDSWCARTGCRAAAAPSRHRCCPTRPSRTTAHSVAPWRGQC